MSFGAVAASVAGAAVGGMMSKGGGEQTASKDPWPEAAPWLKDLLKSGQGLSENYQRNPFNSLQQTGYQNLFGDLDNYRSNIAPALMQYAQGFMGTQAPNFQSSSGMPQQARQNPMGLLSSEQLAPKGQSYGLLDFQQLNPFTATNGIPSKPTAQPEQQAQKTPEELALEEWERLRLSGMGYQGAGE